MRASRLSSGRGYFKPINELATRYGGFMKNQFKAFSIVLFAWSFAFAANAPVSADIAIANFSDAENDRFTDNTSFIGGGFDFSGVGRTTDDGKWGTLISSNAVLTVQHFRPSNNSTYEFFASNDPNGQSYLANVTKTVQVGSTDLSIAILDRNVDSSIRVYDFATDFYQGQEPDMVTVVDPETGEETVQNRTFFNTDPDEVGIVDMRTLMFGVSPTSRDGDFQIDQAIGENNVTGFSENVRFSSYTDNDSIILERNSGTEALNHESFVRGGDSGAPTFLVVGDDPNQDILLLGANSFQLNGDDFQSTGVTYTGNQVDAISSILADNVIIGNTVSVPEPTSAAVLAAFGVVFLARRKRTSQNR